MKLQEEFVASHCLRGLVAGLVLVAGCGGGSETGEPTPGDDSGEVDSGAARDAARADRSVVTPADVMAAADSPGAGVDVGPSTIDSGRDSSPTAGDVGQTAGDGPRDTGGNTAPDAGNISSQEGTPTGPQPLQKAVAVLFITVGGKPIVPDVKTPGRIKIVEHDGSLKDATALATLASRTPVLDTPMGIEVRGASSIVLEKKSMGIEFHDEAGMEKQLPVLGMPPESDWALYGCFSDKSYLRNALVYAIGREYGRYNPRAQFVEVFIDGKYWGIYLLVEKIKRDKARVALPEVAEDATKGDITGGYIFRKELTGKNPPARMWNSKVGTTYVYHYPRYDRVTPAQKSYLHDYVDRFEAMWAGPDWNNPTKGYRAWIDVGTWVDYSITCEFTFNPDCYRKSVYLAKERQAQGGLLRHHPLWDFDLAFAATGITKTSDFLLEWGATNYGSLMLNYRQIAYWTKVWKDPAFQKDFKCRYQQLRKGPLSDANIKAKMDGWVTLLADVEKRDHTRWPVLNVMVDCCTRKFATYNEAVQQVRDWIKARVAWLDPAVAKMPGTCSSN